MNNKGQNGNPNGTPQIHHPNQGYPQQNNQYQGNGYNGQNPQNFNRNINNQNPYQNQNSQRNNMNNPQYRGQGYNGQNPQYNNMNNQQYRGQGNNGQNPQFGNPNNPQFSNQNGYNNPNQFNPQFGNNQNFNPMNRRPKMDSKMVGYITAVVAAILVVLMIFMFSSGSGKLGGGTPKEAVKNVISATKDGDSKKLGGATPEEAVKNVLSAEKDGDYKKAINNTYLKSDEARTKLLEHYNSLDGYRKELAERYSDMEIGKVKSIDENRAIVEYKFSGDTTENIYYVKKVNGRWFAENMFSYLD